MLRSIGVGELLVIVAVAAALFAPTLLAFWLGYVFGTKRSTPAPSSVPPVSAPESPDVPPTAIPPAAPPAPNPEEPNTDA